MPDDRTFRRSTALGYWPRVAPSGARRNPDATAPGHHGGEDLIDARDWTGARTVSDLRHHQRAVRAGSAVAEAQSADDPAGELVRRAAAVTGNLPVRAHRRAADAQPAGTVLDQRPGTTVSQRATAVSAAVRHDGTARRARLAADRTGDRRRSLSGAAAAAAAPGAAARRRK